jgi:flavocytochrome c
MAVQKSVRTNVLVVGSGAVGVTASIEAREAGADVIVLEKEPTLGGAAVISGGGCCLVGTSLQEDSGIEDSVDLAFEDWIRWGGGSADEQWVRFYLENTRDGVFEWCKERGVNWVGVNKNEGNTVGRWHRPDGGGSGLWRALHATSLEKGITDWRTSTAAKELIIEGGKVVGVRAENTETGETTDFCADAVVMGSGGFASNLDMLLEHRPDLHEHRILEGSGVGDTGDGHRLVTDVGGVLTHMKEIWFYTYAIPDHRDPNGRRGLVIRGVPDAIWVNMLGRRFHNEDLSGGNSGSPAVMAQDPAYCWTVLDDSMKDGITVSDPYYYQPGSNARDWGKVRQMLDESPYVKHGDTLEALAEDIGLRKDDFIETVNRYNSFIDQGLERCPDLGRPLAGRKMIEQPPFYALNFTPLARKSLGGVKTNFKCQAVDKHYEPIERLYAAGELAGMAGGHINGKAGLEGTMLGPSLFSGRVAGAWAAHDAGFGPGFGSQPYRH